MCVCVLESWELIQRISEREKHAHNAASGQPQLLTGPGPVVEPVLSNMPLSRTPMEYVGGPRRRDVWSIAAAASYASGDGRGDGSAPDARDRAPIVNDGERAWLGSANAPQVLDSVRRPPSFGLGASAGARAGPRGSCRRDTGRRGGSSSENAGEEEVPGRRDTIHLSCCC